MRSKAEITKLWGFHHSAYQREKKKGNHEAEFCHAEICRILEWVIS